MDGLSMIFERKSVRHFQPNKSVSKEDLTTLVKAGMAAPSAVNKRPWAFVVITRRETLDTLGEHLPYAKMLKQAPAAIVVCGDLHNALPDDWQEFWIQDCSAATQNILLAAEALHLGAVWTAAYPAEDRIDTVRQALALPEHIIPLNVIPIGYPAGNDKPKDKWNPDNVHWERW
ncbi:nitroreductase [Candidatus Vecturithrix granuli]|uniref:Nitroreductase n=1 Tax=Vecturithrix granuli TaxID=1499967 RepID=A0A081BU44_VECG1|nr:nitroreductase [Candidatus Vecturithrix granuli]